MVPCRNSYVGLWTLINYTIYLCWCHKPPFTWLSMAKLYPMWTRTYRANMSFAVPLGQWFALHPSVRLAGASCPPAAASKSAAGWNLSSLRKLPCTSQGWFQQMSTLNFSIYANTMQIQKGRNAGDAWFFDVFCLRPPCGQICDATLPAWPMV